MMFKLRVWRRVRVIQYRQWKRRRKVQKKVRAMRRREVDRQVRAEARLQYWGRSGSVGG